MQFNRSRVVTPKATQNNFVLKNSKVLTTHAPASLYVIIPAFSHPLSASPSQLTHAMTLVIKLPGFLGSTAAWDQDRSLQQLSVFHCSLAPWIQCTWTPANCAHTRLHHRRRTQGHCRMFSLSTTALQHPDQGNSLSGSLQAPTSGFLDCSRTSLGTKCRRGDADCRCSCFQSTFCGSNPKFSVILSSEDGGTYIIFRWQLLSVSRACLLFFFPTAFCAAASASAKNTVRMAVLSFMVTGAEVKGS